MPIFSFVIPVYNAEKTIERCVTSIINNNRSDIEIILVEDCSKDNSRLACQRLSEKYGQVVALYNEKNRGVSYTRNRGLDNASGKYILFCDSDDYIEPNYVETFSLVADEGFDFAICGYVNHDEKANGKTDIYSFDETKSVSLLPLLEEIHEKNLLQQLWNKLFSAEIIKNNNIRFDETISIGEDFRFILEYLKYGEITETKLINSALYHYMRDQAGSLMYRVGYESIEEPLKNLRTLYELMGKSESEIEEIISAKRESQKSLYAYLIMHNMGMPLSERRRLILALDEVDGKKMFKNNLVVLIKERIAKLLKK